MFPGKHALGHTFIKLWVWLVIWTLNTYEPYIHNIQSTGFKPIFNWQNENKEYSWIVKYII